MKPHTQANISSFLTLAIGLWSGYLLILAIIDHVLYLRPIFSHTYYLITSIDALIILGGVLWIRSRATQVSVLIPLIIFLMSVVPLISGNTVVLAAPKTPAHGPASLLLRQMPFTFLALILTAWYYNWRALLVFIGGITLLMTIWYLVLEHHELVIPALTIVLIQTISLLVVGHYICTLIGHLKEEQTLLARANAQLKNHATMLEELTISRERNRMARELHDTLAHTLSGLSVQLEAVKAYWRIDDTVAKQLLDTSLATTRAGLQETRRALKSLRASPLDDLGLLLALREVATETAARANLTLTLDIPDTLPLLPPHIEHCIYRIAQEAATNAAHHANARTLSIELTCAQSITLRVRDDGRGFNPQQDISQGHFGIAGMRERANLVGGILTITSQPEQGTTVRLVIEEEGYQ